MSSTKFDAELEKIEIFQKYPEMLPFVGENYCSDQHKQILIVAESHYMPDGSTVQNDAEKWYQESRPLLQEEREWIDTRGVVLAKPTPTMRNIEQAMREAGVPQSDNLFREVAFMNYFARPGENRKSIEETEDDKKIALETFLQVEKIIRPDAIFFVSTSTLLAAEEGEIWEKMPNTLYSYSPCPVSSWWNRRSRKHNNLTGKEKFIEFIKEQFFK